MPLVESKKTKADLLKAGIRCMTDHQLYCKTKQLISSEHFRGQYSDLLDVCFDECSKRQKPIFEKALDDAQFTINSLENIMKDLHIIDIKRIDFMSNTEINMLFQSSGAALNHPNIADIDQEITTFLDIIGIPKENMFICTVAGTSMEGLIEENDRLFVDSSRQPENGDIIIADIDGNLLVKRYDKSNGKLVLRSDNPAFEPIIVHNYSHCEIYGVVVHVLKSVKLSRNYNT